MTNISQLIIGIVGAIMTILLYKLSRQQVRDSWLRTYKELHELFWSDPVFQEVRLWLACDAAYESVQQILIKRRAIDEQLVVANTLTEDEYKSLEKLDRFFNFLLRIIVINPEFKRRQDLWKKLFFDYWLVQVSQRMELLWYVKRFYEEELYALLPVSVTYTSIKPQTKLRPHDE